MASTGGLIGLQGRLGRLRYLYWLIVAQGLCAGIFFGIAHPLLARGSFTAGLGWLIFTITYITGGLTMVVLVARRLHDIGLSAAHILWIGPLYVVFWVHWGAGPPYGDVAIGVALAVALVGIGLILVPGQAGANRYGPERE